MSQYPVITAGMEPTSLLLQSMLPQDAYKAADQILLGGVGTLVNDSALAVPLAASAKYTVSLLVYYTGGTAGSSDIQFGFAVPSGASSTSYRYLGFSTSLALQYGTVILSGAAAFGTNGTNILTAELALTISTSLTPGNLQLQWSQFHGTATNTTVKAGSLLTARRIA